MPSICTKSVRDAQGKSRIWEIGTYDFVMGGYQYFSWGHNKQKPMEVL